MFGHFRILISKAYVRDIFPLLGLCHSQASVKSWWGLVSEHRQYYRINN